VIFALADLGKVRNDVASANREAAYLHSGWAENFDRDPVPTTP